MTIAYQSSASAEATSLTLPSHQAGDILLMVAYKSTNNPATIPSGWMAIANANFVSIAGNSLFAFKVAQTNSETSGTWTGAELLVCAVYRPTSNYHMANVAAINRIATSVQVNLTQKSSYNLVNSSEFNLQASASVVVGIITTDDITAGIDGARTSLTLRASHAGTSVGKIAIYDTSTATSSFAFNSAFLGSAINTVNATVELLDIGITQTAGGGVRIPNIRGGADQ